MRRRVASRGAADVREQHRVGRGEQPRVHLGLAFEDVDAGAEDRAVLERDRERLLVDHRAARGVHQHRRALHQREPTRVDQAASSPVVQRHVQRHDVGDARAGRRDRRPTRSIPVSWREWCSTSMPNPAARRPTAWPMRPYPTIPERARRARRRRGSRFDVEPRSIGRCARSASASDVRAGGRQHQEEREVGGGLVEDAGRVAHRDAELGRRSRRRCCRSPPRRRRRHGAAEHRPAARAASMRSVSMHTIASTSATAASQLVGRERRVVAGSALHELVAGRDEGVEPAVGQLHG